MVAVLVKRWGICLVWGTFSLTAKAQLAFPPLPPQVVGGTGLVGPAVGKPSHSPLVANDSPKPSGPVARQSFGSWVTTNVVHRIDVTGNRSIGFHAHQVSGDKDAFRSLNYYGNGGSTFSNTGNMTLSGKKVLGVLDFQYQFTDDRIQSPDTNRMTLNYDRGPIKVGYGDVRASLLNTNPFASFNRSLFGLTSQFKSGRTQMSVIRSEVKAAAKTISLNGNNTAGPYYLQAGRLIADSVEVRLDGQVMRLMQDYVVDSDQGSITFVSRIILPTSSIVASFEASGFNQSSGIIQGAGVSYDFGKIGRAAFTQIEQRGNGSGTNKSLLETFQGYGDPSIPYTLQYSPILGTVIVRVNGTVQVEGPDYRFDAQIPSRFFFLRYVPNTDTVSATYRPSVVQTLNGDRRVVGFDYRVPLGLRGESGYVQYSMARGELMSKDSPRSGTSRGITASYQTGGLRLTSDFRDIPATYVSVQSQGFSRNERAATIGAELTRGKFVYGASNSNSLVSSENSASNPVTYSNSRVTSTRGYVNYSEPSGTSWTLENIKSYTRNLYENRLNTTSLTGHRMFGKFDATVGLDVQNGFGRQSVDNQSRNGTLALRTYRIGGRYTPSDRFALDTRLSLSQISSLAGSGTGTDISMTGTYRPGPAWTLGAGYSVSDSGQLATLGSFNTGSGVGYGGNGFSSGSTLDSYTAGAASMRLLQLSAGFRASERINLTSRYYQTRNEGDLNSNTQTRSYGFGADWDLGRQTLVGGSIDRSLTDYLGSSLGYSSETTTYDVFFQASPKGPWSYRVGVTGLISSGGSANRQNTFNADTSLIYRISPRQRTWVSYNSGRTTGYYGQDTGFLGLFYDYQIYHAISLVGSFKSRRVLNLDPSLQTGSYRSTGFDVELSFGLSP